MMVKTGRTDHYLSRHYAVFHNKVHDVIERLSSDEHQVYVPERTPTSSCSSNSPLSLVRPHMNPHILQTKERKHHL